MVLPQELIDMILDEINLQNIKWRHLMHPRKRLRTLRACARVSHAFARRSQMHLFSVVQLDMLEPGPAGLLAHFSELLSSSPHIAAHVRELSLQHTYGEAQHLSHILSCLPNLERLATVSAVDYEQAPWQYHDALLKDAFLAALTVPSFRCIDLSDHEFSDATELDSVLSNSPSLRDVRFYRVAFKNRTPKAEPESAARPRHSATIESLTVSAMTAADVESLLDLSYAVDFTHVKRLRLGMDTAPAVLQVLLRENASSIQELRILDTSQFHVQSPGPDAQIPGSASLRSLHIHSASVDYVCYTLGHFDGLHHLTALKTLTLHLGLFTDFKSFCTLYQWQWEVLDGVLAKAGEAILAGLMLDVRVWSRFSFIDPATVQLVKDWLPSLKGKVFVQIADNAPDSKAPDF
ncbi:hypothetical protein C8R44DRAFT_986712 [Mycena epipterygia]|nr:hypothetical protein C8R44DRAFT_986712 [Mycena epipterygia]